MILTRKQLRKKQWCFGAKEKVSLKWKKQSEKLRVSFQMFTLQLFITHPSYPLGTWTKFKSKDYREEKKKKRKLATKLIPFISSQSTGSHQTRNKMFTWTKQVAFDPKTFIQNKGPIFGWSQYTDPLGKPVYILSTASNIKRTPCFMETAFLNVPNDPSIVKSNRTFLDIILLDSRAFDMTFFFLPETRSPFGFP